MLHSLEVRLQNALSPPFGLGRPAIKNHELWENHLSPVRPTWSPSRLGQGILSNVSHILHGEKSIPNSSAICRAKNHQLLEISFHLLHLTTAITVVARDEVSQHPRDRSQELEAPQKEVKTT